MSNEVAVAIVTAVGVVTVAAFTYLGIVLNRRNGPGPAVKATPGAKTLTAEDAQRMIAQAITNLKIEERLADQDKELVVLRAALAERDERILRLEGENRDLREQIKGHLRTIENQAREILELRQLGRPRSSLDNAD